MIAPQRVIDEVTDLGASPLIRFAVAIGLLYWGRAFFVTLAIAVTLAFILEPFVAMLMRIRFPRALASFVVCSIALLLIYLIGLAGYSQVASLMDDYQQNYSRRVYAIVETVRNKIGEMEQATYELIVPARQKERHEQAIERRKMEEEAQRKAATRKKSKQAPPDLEPVPLVDEENIPEVRIRSDRTPITEYLYMQLQSLYQAALMASFIPFLVYFMLSWRDHIHRSFLQFFQGEDRAVAAKTLQGIAAMVRAFVVGNFALGLLLAVLSSLIFWKINLPYPLLVGPLSGFMSLVPYIGLPLALIPPLLVALTVFEGISSYIVITLIVTGLHVVALNLLYPKLVGSRVHLNPLVVTVALMFWGFLWDAAGLVLAIPLTAGIKAVCDNVRDLRRFGKFLGD